MPTAKELFKPINFQPINDDNVDNGIYTYINPPKKRQSHPFTVYPIRELHLLIAETLKYSQKLAESADPFEDDPWTMSYIVDLNYKMWFAAKTDGNQSTPAHHQMTGKVGTESKCIAAGRVHFTENFASIFKIDYNSSDFNPSFQSLQWPLAILVANKPDFIKSSVVIPDVIQVAREADPLGKKVYKLPFLSTMDWVVERFVTLQELWTQPSATKKISPPIPVVYPGLQFYPPAGTTAVMAPPPSTTDDDPEPKHNGPPAKRIKF